MEKKVYYGIVHKDNNSEYGVSFPDFPGCVTAGKDMPEAIAMAQEAIDGHIALMQEDGDAIPDPTKADDIAMQYNGISLIPVTVKIKKAKFTRLSITARENDLRIIDSFLKKSGRRDDRSSFLIRSAIEHIQASK
jgi:predicted RNase H-like HicB family nuclease